MKKYRTKEFFRRLHQKKIIRWFIHFGFHLTFPLVWCYAHYIEPRLVKITRFSIPIPKLPLSLRQFRIVQISDLHFGPTNRSESFLKKCIEKINALKPDLVALTGDFVQWDMRYLNRLSRILSRIKASFGCFAVLGNHDYGVCHQGEPPTDPIDHERVIRELKAHGIQVLHNEAQIIKKGREGINVVGVGDYWTSFFNPQKAFGQKKIGPNPTILLSHNPDSIDQLKKFDFDLMLSGHAHGGQISLPWIGPLAMPIKNSRLRRGLHRIGKRWLYTNRGLGYIFKARLLSPPEIACLELVPA